MTKAYSVNQKEHDEDLQRLTRLRIMDDDFMRCVLRDRPDLVQRILRIVMGLSDIEVLASETQRDLKRLAGARSVELDVWARDSKGTEYDVEIQRGDDPNPRRLRYHSACMDVEVLEQGHAFEELPEQWVIFVMEEDPYQEGEGTYLYEYARKGKALGDGTHLLYVNGAYDADDDLGRLMHDFRQSDPGKIKDEDLARRVRYWKESPEGVGKMCEMLESMRNEAMQKGLEEGKKEGALDAVARLVRGGLVSIAEAATHAGVSEDELRQVLAQG